MSNLIIDDAVLRQYNAAGFQVMEANTKYVVVCNLIGERSYTIGLIAELEEAFEADFVQFLDRTAVLRWRT